MVHNKAVLCLLLAGVSLPAMAPEDTVQVDASNSAMRPYIERYTTDRATLQRMFSSPMAPAAQERMKKFQADWLERIGKLDFDGLTEEGKVDYILFRNYVEHDSRQLDLQSRRNREMAPMLPFEGPVLALEEARRSMKWIEGRAAAEALVAIEKQVTAVKRSLESEMRQSTSKRSLANQAAVNAQALRGILKHWYDFYNGYDPLFTWWTAEPYKATDAALQAYAKFLREKIAGVRSGADAAPEPLAGPGRRGGGGLALTGTSAVAQAGDTSDIVGVPVGRDGLMSELAYEMIPYTPEELIAIANKEFAWCEGEMKRASRELGYGDDWHKALEHVKNLYVDPGKQTTLIRDLALEAVDFLKKNDLVTVPELSNESWHIEMMAPERQLVNPFFLGGDLIIVSYPTSTMTHEQKMMGMRGNNPHFSRATVFHELTPGHHLQGYMAARYHTYREAFRTPFYGEGWSLYWELLMWDLKFGKTPEDRIGMLFWHMHRCARIIFSLSFHMEKMTPQECVDFLVDRVGHERENAAGEVRRSFDGSYGPLYQAAYLLGGMQLHDLHRELVESGKMTNRAFHDAVLKEGSIPIEMVRASLMKQRLTRDFVTSWKFRGPNPLGN